MGWYAFTRASQLRRLRVPKPRVEAGRQRLSTPQIAASRRSRGSITRNVGLDARARRHPLGQVAATPRSSCPPTRARALPGHGPPRTRRRRVVGPHRRPPGPAPRRVDHGGGPRRRRARCGPGAARCSSTTSPPGSPRCSTTRARGSRAGPTSRRGRRAGGRRAAAPGRVVLVSAEVGLGVVPGDPGRAAVPRRAGRAQRRAGRGVRRGGAAGRGPAAAPQRGPGQDDGVDLPAGDRAGHRGPPRGGRPARRARRAHRRAGPARRAGRVAGRRAGQLPAAAARAAADRGRRRRPRHRRGGGLGRTRPAPTRAQMAAMREHTAPVTVLAPVAGDVRAGGRRRAGRGPDGRPLPRAASQRAHRPRGRADRRRGRARRSRWAARSPTRRSTPGADLLVPASIGVGATTPASTMVAALTGTEPVAVIGRGSGIDDAGWMRKAAAVRDALRRARPRRPRPAGPAPRGGRRRPRRARRVLPAGRGAAHAGAARRARRRRRGAARRRAGPGRARVVAGRPALPRARDGDRRSQRLGLTPVVDLGVRLGDGTGAAAVVPLLQMAARLLGETAVVVLVSVRP